MRKNRIQNVVVHPAGRFSRHSLATRISRFHVDIIERRLRQLSLSTEQKIEIIDKIIIDLKLREVNGIIK